jgi:hypothetical protein
MQAFNVHERQIQIACNEEIVFFGPGHGGSANGGAVQVTPGEWPEGNPEIFWAIQWTRGPIHGEAQYVSRGSNRFTWFENKGTKSARTLAGKRVCAAFWLRTPNSGVSVIPVIWRGNLDLPVEERTPFPEISMQLWSGNAHELVAGEITRVEFAKDLPQIPSGVSVGPTSYLGIGLDFADLYGNVTMHMGPYALYEVKGDAEDTQAIEEIPYWDEVLACMADKATAMAQQGRRRGR